MAWSHGFVTKSRHKINYPSHLLGACCANSTFLFFCRSCCTTRQQLTGAGLLASSDLDIAMRKYLEDAYTKRKGTAPDGLWDVDQRHGRTVVPVPLPYGRLLQSLALPRIEESRSKFRLRATQRGLADWRDDRPSDDVIASCSVTKRHRVEHMVS